MKNELPCQRAGMVDEEFSEHYSGSNSVLAHEHGSVTTHEVLAKQEHRKDGHDHEWQPAWNSIELGKVGLLHYASRTDGGRGVSLRNKRGTAGRTSVAVSSSLLARASAAAGLIPISPDSISRKTDSLGPRPPGANRARKPARYEQVKTPTA